MHNLPSFVLIFCLNMDLTLIEKKCIQKNWADNVTSFEWVPCFCLSWACCARMMWFERGRCSSRSRCRPPSRTRPSGESRTSERNPTIREFGRVWHSELSWKKCVTFSYSTTISSYSKPLISCVAITSITKKFETVWTNNISSNFCLKKTHSSNNL